MKILFVLLSSLLIAPTAVAELTRNSEESFTTSHSVSTAADSFVVYRTMTAHIDQWWNGEHSWSGDAANLYLDTKKERCFCERLPDGGRVEHLRIIYHAHGSELRFEGALGPLQLMAVQGRMTWKIEALENGSQIQFTYTVFGHPEGGLGGIAPAVDGVIGEQLARLAERLARN